MVRSVLISAILLTLAACKGGNADALADRDSRYDLARYNMNSILVSDIKVCKNLMRLGSLGVSQIDGSLREAFELSAQMWKNIGLDINVYGDDAEALSKGFFVPEVPAGLVTIFAEGDDVEARSNKCGIIAGELVVKVGLMSTRKSIDLAEATNPGIFKNMGVSDAQLETLKDAVEKRVSDLGEVDKSSVLSCVAISQADKLRGKDVSKSGEVWIQVLNSRLANNEFASKGFSKENPFWDAFAKSGAREISQVDNYEAERASCQAHVASVIPG